VHISFLHTYLFHLLAIRETTCLLLSGPFDSHDFWQKWLDGKSPTNPPEFDRRFSGRLDFLRAAPQILYGAAS
jgi:hypothetical protein